MPPKVAANTRATRSRYSSPQQHGVSDGSGGGGGNGNSHGHGHGHGHGGDTKANGGTTNAQRAMMARWLEPPVQNRSSFEEAGFQRHGVFETMAPLGTLPKASAVARRLNNMPEEKIYNQNDFSLTRNNQKQQQQQQQQQQLQKQKEAELKEQERERREREQQGHEQQDEERQEDAQEQPKEESLPPPQEQTELEPEQQDNAAPHRRKIILKRPSSGRHVTTRILVDPAAEGAPRDREEDETDTGDMAAGDTGDDKADAEYKPPSLRLSGPRARLEDDSGRTKQPAKRPVGRPRSRRSIVAESSQREEAADKADRADAAGDAAGNSTGDSAGDRARDSARDSPGSANASADSAGAAADNPAGLAAHTGNAENHRHHLYSHRSDGAEDSDDDMDDYSDSMTDEDDSDGEPVGAAVFGSLNRLNRLARFNVKRPRSDSNATVVNKEVTDKVVEMAVDEALSHCRYPTAFALRTLYDEQSSDQNFLTMVEDVFQQTADAETLKTFARLIYEKKKDGKKDGKGYYYFVPPSAESQSTPPRSRTAPYGHLVTMRLPELGTDSHVSKKMKLANGSADPSSGEAPLIIGTPSAPATGPGSSAVSSDGASDKNRPKTPQPSAQLPKAKTPKTPKTPKTAKTARAPRTPRTPRTLRTPRTPKTSPAKALKTPAKSPGRAAGEAAGTAAGSMSVSKNANGVATPASRRQLRNRSGSAASSLSSLSPPGSLSPPDHTMGEDEDTIDGEATEEEHGEHQKEKKEEGVAAAAVGRDVDVHAHQEEHEAGGDEQPGRRSRRVEADRRRSSAAAAAAASESGERGKGNSKAKASSVSASASESAPASAPASISASAPVSVPSSAPALAPAPASAAAVGAPAKGKAGGKKGKAKPGTTPTSGPGSGRGGRRRGAGRPPKIKKEGQAAAAAATAKGAVAKGTAGAAALGSSGSPPKAAATPAGPTTPAGPHQRTGTRNRSSRKTTDVAPASSALISPSASLQNQGETQAHTHQHQHQNQGQNHQNQNHHHNSTTKASAASGAVPASHAMPAAVSDSASVSVRTVSVAKRAALQRNGSDVLSLAPSSSLKAASVFASRVVGAEDLRDLQERRANLRRESRNVTNGMQAVESFARGGPLRGNSDINGDGNGDGPGDGNEIAEHSSRRASMSTSTSDAGFLTSGLQTPQTKGQGQRQLRASTTTARATRSARKRTFDEIDDDLSPARAAFPSEEPQPESQSESQSQSQSQSQPQPQSQTQTQTQSSQPPLSSASSARLQTPIRGQQPVAAAASTGVSALNSRVGTPGPKPKRPRVGPRVKTSPMKRKTGTSAGVPRPSGERGSPSANGPSHNPDENDDYCASCGGSGELVCCDGCARSFHFNCVDPPLQEGGDLPEEWFCNVCASSRNPVSLNLHQGVFGPLLNAIEKENSSAFSLPDHIRNRFEGVKTGQDGEYENIVAPGTNRAKKRGYEETPDFYRIRDSEGRAVLCHSCHGYAKADRPIIPCAYCGLWWHIDCLDPPLANPPVLRNWRCPAHVDDILDKLPGLMGPAHRFRKIKNSSSIKSSYSRGLPNNGFVEFDSDDESDSNAASGVCTFGRIHRISAKGLKLDFLEQIRKEQKGKRRHARINRRMRHLAFNAFEQRDDAVAIMSLSPSSAFLPDRRGIDEAQAIHNLSALSASSDLNVDRSGELINALLAQADSTAIALMAQGSALNIEAGSVLTQGDRAALAAMRARIDRLLGLGSGTPDVDVAMADATAAVASYDEQLRESDEAASKSSPDQTQDVMSLVSDNGESELGEEDPLPIATPLTAVHEESATAAVWPAEHHSSDSVSGPSSGGLPEGKEAFLCSPKEVQGGDKGPGDQKTSPAHTSAAVATPLTPPLGSLESALDQGERE